MLDLWLNYPLALSQAYLATTGGNPLDAAFASKVTHGRTRWDIIVSQSGKVLKTREIRENERCEWNEQCA